MTKKQFQEIANTVLILVTAVMVAFGLFQPEANQPTARGVTNFDSITLGEDLIVGDDTTITGDLTVSGATTTAAQTLTGLTVNGNGTITGTLDIGGEPNYGTNDLNILGFGSAGQQAVYGTASITGTLAAPHGLTTVTFCLASLGEDPTAGAGDAAHVTVAVSANVCTLKAWQDDFVTAATEADVAVQWLVIGAP